ncbi:probable cytochrome P450 6a13 [Euwallacea similis]|uniref:probable cytochrome P450 6a13 n=1 Tax=Euwallacea similis TaxID=1736056 RepID=UPI00344E393B
MTTHPKIQENLRKEILDSLNKSKKQITYQSISEVEYLKKVLKETLRRYSILSIITRASVKDYNVASNITLSKGTRVITVTSLHWDPKFYLNSKQFNPEIIPPERIAARSNSA